MGEYLVTQAKEPGPGLVSGILDQLQHGLGYTAYRKREQARKDDQLLRNRTCELVLEAKRFLQAKATAWRKVNLVCTREHPVPTAENLAVAQAMDALIQEVSSLETQIRNAALPEDGIDEGRHRQASAYLPQLQLCDTQLLQVALRVRDLAETESPDSGHEALFREALEDVKSSLRKRQGVFSGFLSIQS